MRELLIDRAVVEQVLNDVCGAKLCEVNSMSSRVESRRLLDKATTALRAALETSHKVTSATVEQPAEQVPVAWACWADSQDPAKHEPTISTYKPTAYDKVRPLVYGDTAPQPAKRVELTDEEIVSLWYPIASVSEPGTRRVAFARAVIAAYERKNGIGG